MQKEIKYDLSPSQPGVIRYFSKNNTCMANIQQSQITTSLCSQLTLFQYFLFLLLLLTILNDDRFDFDQRKAGNNKKNY